MKIIEGTPAEIVEYERLHASNDPPVAGPGTNGQRRGSELSAFAWRHFPEESAEFTIEYVTRALKEFSGLKPVIIDKGNTHYLRLMWSSQAWSGAVVYVHPVRVDVRVRHDDIEDLSDRVERKRLESDSNEFRAALRRQTVDDVDLAIELTRRAIERSRTVD